MTTQEREQLILNYLPLANKLAWDKNKNTPICVTVDELKSAAYMGLVDAANKFDENRGVVFGAYARLRICGEISDYLRQLHWSGSNVKMMSLDVSIDDSTTLTDGLKAKPSGQNEFFKKVTKPLSAIGERIVRMYYEEDKTLKEIGVEEDISESRVCQVLKECRQKIGRKFEAHELVEELAA